MTGRVRRWVPPGRVTVLLVVVWALGGAALGVVLFASAPDASTAGPAAGVPSADRSVLGRRGRTLFAEGCASCHGPAGAGVAGRGPSLRGVGAAAVDFYLSTGRMPLESPGVQPTRSSPAYGPKEIAALTAYVVGLAPGGPPIPRVQPALGSVRRGRALFADKCSGCHQIMGQGGAAPGFVAPSLDEATPRQIGEAIRVGPYLMPRFSSAQVDDRDVDSIARFVTEVVRRPPDRGGWGIGNIGPVPEGLVAILLAGGALLIIIRVIGERLR